MDANNIPNPNLVPFLQKYLRYLSEAEEEQRHKYDKAERMLYGQRGKLTELRLRDHWREEVIERVCRALGLDYLLLQIALEDEADFVATYGDQPDMIEVYRDLVHP